MGCALSKGGGLQTMNIVSEMSFNSVGADVVIHPLARIVDPEKMSIGDSVIIDDFVFLYAGGAIEIGSFVHIAVSASVAGGGRLVVEDFCGLSGGVRVYTGNDDYLGGSLTGPTVPFPYRVPIRGEVFIQKHAIIGANSVILPGVVIGEGTAVGANSLITKDLEPWSGYVGNPARRVKERPRAKILELEAELKETLYDRDGKYIPNDLR